MTDRDRIRILRAALKEAALHFRAYEALHKEKGYNVALTHQAQQEAFRKARDNHERAINCERALQDTI